MKFRAINIPKIVYQILRSNYAIRRDIVDEKVVLSLNGLYKFIVCCLYDLKTYFSSYNEARKRNYMIASCMPILGQTSLVLNELFGKYGEIELNHTNYQSIYFYDQDSSTADNQVYLYTEDQNNPLYLGYKGSSSNNFVVRVPIGLSLDTELYSEFTSVLNSILMYGIRYKIITYNPNPTVETLASLVPGYNLRNKTITFTNTTKPIATNTIRSSRIIFDGGNISIYQIGTNFSISYFDSVANTTQILCNNTAGWSTTSITIPNRSSIVSSNSLPGDDGSGNWSFDDTIIS